MKKSYIVEGLDCPNCAREVEEHLKHNKNLKNVSLNFVTKKLFLEGEEAALNKDEISKSIACVESGVTLNEETSAKKRTSVMTKAAWIILFRVIFSSLLVALTRIFINDLPTWLGITLYLISYAIVSYDIIYKVFRNVFIKHKFFDENMLMFIATIGAIALGDYFEAVLVMLLNQVGEMLQHISVEKSKNAILNTLDLRADTANLVVDGQVVIVNPEQLKIGDIVLLKAGDLVPVDGVIIDGRGSFDTSSLTGETLPLEGEKDTDILSGMTLLTGTIYMQTKRLVTESTAAKVMDLVANSSQNKSKAEHFISKFAAFYTPIVFALAIIIGIVLPLFNGEWSNYIGRALSFLVISCPCAIIISIPLAYFVGLGMSAKRGVIIKGANYLDLLNNVDAMVFDKTGTLTYGRFEVSEVHLANGMDEKTFHNAIYQIEKLSNHPIAAAIVKHFAHASQNSEISDIEEMAGMGIGATINGQKVLAGNGRMMKKYDIVIPNLNTHKTSVFVALDGVYAGYVLVSDQVKATTKTFIDKLNARKIKTTMLTGDKAANAQMICQELGITNYHAELLPQDKLTILEQDLDKTHTTMYIGDGINDAPSIMRADIGVAMGGVGSDIAVQSADIVVMNDDLQSIAKAMKIARITRRQAIFNIVLALTIKIIVLLLVGFNINLGISNMIVAVIADVGLSLFLVLITMLMSKMKV